MSESREIKWLFEQNVFDDGNPQTMAGIVKSRGMTCVEVGFESVSGNENLLRPSRRIAFTDSDIVMVYGSMNLMKSLLGQKKWHALAWYDFSRLCCHYYYAYWGQFLLQRNYAFLPLAELRRRRDWVFKTFAQNNAVFVRPDDYAKSFSGGLVSADHFEEWYKLANFYEPGPDCLAVVSSPERIQAEWRLVIGEKKVVTGSQYRRDGKEEISAGCPSEVVHFAETVANANRFEPHPMYVMDIANTDAGYRLVEIGSMCCASLYACDLTRVIDVVSRIAKLIE